LELTEALRKNENEKVPYLLRCPQVSTRISAQKRFEERFEEW
jgi:hypothetical protein